jgi:hypothetical protein
MMFGGAGGRRRMDLINEKVVRHNAQQSIVRVHRCRHVSTSTRKSAGKIQESTPVSLLCTPCAIPFALITRSQ